MSDLSESALPLVFLPGASGRASYLRPLAEKLGCAGQARFLDYPGLGDEPRGAISSLEELFQWVVARIPPRADFVALSMGSLFALRLALEHPERVGRLVLLAPVGGLPASAFEAEDWRPAWRARRPEAPRWILDDATDLSERLSEVRARTLLVCGGRDSVSPVSLSRFVSTRIAEAELRVVAEGTHDLEDEHPDVVAHHIAEHLGFCTARLTRSGD